MDLKINIEASDVTAGDLQEILNLLAKKQIITNKTPIRFITMEIQLESEAAPTQRAV